MVVAIEKEDPGIRLVHLLMTYVKSMQRGDNPDHASTITYLAMLLNWMKNIEVGILAPLQRCNQVACICWVHGPTCCWLGNSRWVHAMERSGQQDFVAFSLFHVWLMAQKENYWKVMYPQFPQSPWCWSHGPCISTKGCIKNVDEMDAWQILLKLRPNQKRKLMTCELN